MLRRLAPLALFTVLVLLASAPFGHALREVLTVSRDARPVISIRSFGYDANGVFDAMVTNFEVFSSDPTEARKQMWFGIDVSDEPIDVVSFPANKCLQNEFPMDYKTIEGSSLNITQTISTPGNYHLYFVNCARGAEVSFKLKLRQWNTYGDGKKNYLSVGEQQLPAIYGAFAGVTAAALVAWIYMLIMNRKDVRDIHLFMGLVAVFTMLTLSLESAKYAHLRSYGNDNALTIVYYVVNAVRGFLFFSVVVLIGTGWSYMKPFLTSRDKTVVVATLAIQVIVNVASVVVDATSPGTFGWTAWNNLFLVADCVCLAISIVPVFRSIEKLQEESRGDVKLASHVQRVKNFRNFYLAFFVYVYLTRFVPRGVSWLVGYRYAYVAACIRESFTTLFLLAAGYLFRPQSQNPYLVLEGVDFEDPDEILGSGNDSTIRSRNASKSGAVDAYDESLEDNAVEMTSTKHQQQRYQQGRQVARDVNADDGDGSDL